LSSSFDKNERRIPMQNPAESALKIGTFAAPGHILVATDLTDTEYLINHAVAQASSSGSRVTLVHAKPPSDLVPLDGSPSPHVDEAKLVRDIRLTLLGVARQVEAKGIPCNVVVRLGNASDVILEELKRNGATRLILGTQARGKLGQVVIGSVAHQLLTKVQVPMFVVGPGARNAAEHISPRLILHPVSLLDNYEESLHLAFEIAQRNTAELVLLHVLDRNVNENINPERTMEWARHALNALAASAPYTAPPVRTSVSWGDPANEIVRAAGFFGADWVVLGANGGHRFWSFNESVAYKVLSKVECPVMTLSYEPYPVEHKKLEDVHFTSPL
jgi:nucleotide-binding universal stress UspA family protein